jgi:thiamine biosynthesis lipoprotein ApbE
VRDRFDADTARALLPLADAALSTAAARSGLGRPHGDDGQSAGQGAPVCSVAVVAADALTAHALSQALLVLGIERGLRLVEQQGAQAVIVDGDARLHASRGLQAMPGAALPDERRASA